MKNNPKKLSPSERRKQLYFQKWGLNEKNSTGDLRSDMRNWVEESKNEEKKKKLSKVTPPKVDVDSITKSRMFYTDLMGGEDD